MFWLLFVCFAESPHRMLSMCCLIFIDYLMRVFAIRTSVLVLCTARLGLHSSTYYVLPMHLS
jgi:hypothetical protein